MMMVISVTVTSSSLLSSHITKLGPTIHAFMPLCLYAFTHEKAISTLSVNSMIDKKKKGFVADCQTVIQHEKVEYFTSRTDAGLSGKSGK